MTRNKAPEWKSRREIPDPQIRDAADQYEAARELLAGQPPGSGLLLPLMNTSAVAIELYLKCLSAEKVYIPCEDGVEGQLVHSEPAIRGHSLTVLFDKIPDDVRCDLAQAYEERKAAASGDLRHNLSLFEGAFMTTRYPFETQADLSAINLRGLMSLSSFLREFVAAIEHRETIQWD